ncbi:MAG: HIT family protein [Rhodococcus sp.]|nr:HIT family protein [Rhodococcus sp. (in: high G+C Gram-positive bacteria)]
MSACAFCSIAAGDGEAHRVYEDDTVVAFLDVRPVTQGHTLVIPKQHAADLTELSADLGSNMFQVGHTLSRALRISDLRADGVNLVVNDGKSAFQTVAHTHLHVVPRQNGDKLRFVKGLLVRRSSDPEGTAAIIREALERAPES